MTPEQIIEKHSALKSNRGVWETHWQEIMDFLIPRKNQIITTTTPGEKKGQLLCDSTGAQACELLAGALHGMLTNPSTVWFELTTGEPALDAKDAVRKWLQNSAHTMHETLNDSNFQTEIHEIYLDLCAPGTACLDIIEDDEADVRFAARSIAEIVVEENNKGVIDSVYRNFKWTARQIAQEFGEGALPDKLKRSLETNSPDTFEIIHAVYPRNLNGVSDTQKKAPKGFKFASKYVLIEDRRELSESGFREFPYAVPRWTKVTGEVYGRSPGMKALPDVKMLNEMKKVVIRAAQKTVDPPLQMPDDGFLLPLKLTPGGVNYFRAGTQDRIEPLQTQNRIDIGNELIQDVKQAVREAFYIDQLQLNQGPQMTATEVQQRTEEKMRLLGPMLGRQQSELLAPMIERVFNILVRKGKISAPPPELQGKEWKVRYSSLIAKAQRTSELQNLNRTIESISPFVQADPTVMDNFDSDKIARWAAKGYGLDQNLLRDMTAVRGLRDARSKAQQEQIQQQNEQHQADLAAKVAPAAAKAKQAGLV